MFKKNKGLRFVSSNRKKFGGILKNEQLNKGNIRITRLNLFTIQMPSISLLFRLF